METPDVSASNASSLTRAAIDYSVKAPVLFLFANAALWLLAATVMGLVASIKLVSPDFLDKDWLWFLNYGRLQPAHMVALVYGWAMQAGLGVCIWLLARRSGQPLDRGVGSMITAAVFWNVGVTLAVVGILSGNGTALQWLEFPAFVWPLLLLSFLIITYRMVTHHNRANRESDFMLSSHYLLAGLFCFPWIFVTANLVLNCFSHGAPLGAFGAGVNAWYVSTLILLFFAPVGLGVCYYFIPKITGQPVHSYQLAQLGFWGLIVLAGWTGMQKYMGGPLPAWMPTIGGMAALLLLVPAGIIALNHHLTTQGQHELIESSPTLRFVFVGSFSFLVMSGIQALLGNLWTGASLQFTHAEYGYHLTAIYGFFSMTMFGAIYYITPRLAGCEWLSARLIRNHFWFSVYGIATLVVCMMVCGMAQGNSMSDPNNWDRSLAGAVRNSHGYLIGRALAWAFILWSNGWFFIHLVFMVLGLGRRSVTPTLLSHGHDSGEVHGEAATAHVTA
ncbi:MAG: cbb3-type cytochrome c oxidase subunit I [Verrucomicrobiaceae bacterium]